MAGQKTILVVDDEPDVVTYLTTLLEDNGYATVAAADGVEALDQVEAQRPDLISLDITMPEKSGVRFYREMRENDATKGIPIIIVTGVAPEFERFISTRKQVPPPDGYMSKPIDRDEMIRMVKDLIG